ncbi:hypothetical protein [Hyalangium sp.]|uniref:hypothetical protein n=1 Tax=Hyalangium sp. TaxID=2028555 RepID=UPI002D6AFDB2|nr:hypothetical protein [Hyalangium sp.]HYH95380.1 hypothetical protein [Hyalangium sp.]
MDTVRQLLESQGYEEALERLGRLKVLARDAEQRLVVSLYEGLALSSMGRRNQDRAQAAFRAALLLDPQANLPVKVPPRLERTFEEVRARVLKELAGQPLSAREVTAPPAPAAEQRVPPSAEPERGQAGAPPELAPEDRLRLMSKWPVLVAPAPPGPTPVAESFRYKASRPRVLVSAITGGALLASGGVFWGLARHEQSRLRKVDLSTGTLDEARSTAARGQRYQTLGFGLAGAGGLALGVATVLYLIQVPQAPVSLGSDGSALLQGTWP